ncbi:MAG: site-2 protease family protein [Sedimentisphaeraceae bacterium JB056]
MHLEYFLTFLPGLIIGITFHEAAHAWSAMLLGDRLAYSQGRVSLNPLKHLSPLGTLALFVLGFGWGRPVMVNLYNFKRPKFYYLLSSLAGPAANLLLCIVCMVILKFSTEETPLIGFVEATYLINGILMMLNLLPIPPLDGSKIWPCIIPGMRPISSSKWNMIWLGVVLVLVYSGVTDKVIYNMFQLLNKALASIIL